MHAPTHQQIADFAYQLYLEDGKPEGEAESHWRRATEILSHPENQPSNNILAVPTEPEITPALDERAKVLDFGLPSDPHSGPEAVHQFVQVAVDGRGDENKAEDVIGAVRSVPGVEKAERVSEGRFVRIAFDARQTNPAAIHDAIEARRAAERTSSD